MEELKDKWFNIEDIAEYLSITQDTARTWVRDGKLPAYKVGKRLIFIRFPIKNIQISSKTNF